MSEERYRKLGVEKPKDLNEDFDRILEKYQKKALEAGLTGELRFIKERGRIVVFAVI